MGHCGEGIVCMGEIGEKHWYPEIHYLYFDIISAFLAILLRIAA
jgi:hypothetical protein